METVKFKNIYDVQLDLLLEIASRQLSLEDAFVNLYSAEKNAPPEDLRKILSETRQDYRTQLMSHLYEKFGHVDMNDILDEDTDVNED